MKDRANELIDQTASQMRHPNEQAVRFAKIIVSLFPDGFDFGQDKFAVVAWDRGLRLIISGDFDLAWISTSASRCMSCIYFGKIFDQARMDMHYRPSEQELERARTVIALAINKLFDRVLADGPPVSCKVPHDRVFPGGWDMSFESDDAARVNKPWWKRWLS